MDGLFQNIWYLIVSGRCRRNNESDQALHGGERLDRNLMRVEALRNGNSAGHDAKIVRPLSGNTRSVGHDIKYSRYKTNNAFYQQYKEGSWTKEKNSFALFHHIIYVTHVFERVA